MEFAVNLKHKCLVACQLIPRNDFDTILEDDVSRFKVACGDMILLFAVGRYNAYAFGQATLENFDVLGSDELLLDFIFAKVKNVNLFVNGQGFKPEKSPKNVEEMMCGGWKIKYQVIY